MSAAIPSQDFISLLRCPATGQRLSLLENEKMHLIVSNATPPIEAALMREDRSVVYPVRGGIPSLLGSEAISCKIPS